jgi:hypothetical protein
MCWNKDISLNTFLFSSFVLLLIMYNNSYTQYKIKEFNSIWVYLFFVSFILMQLIEYFIWINLNDTFYNNIFTILATLLVIVQPIASTMIITNNTIRNTLLSIYVLITIPFVCYRFYVTNINSTISPLGHLRWNTIISEDNMINNVYRLFWLLFFLFPLFYQGLIVGFIFGLLTLLVMFYYYHKDGTTTSMWCWIVNSIMIYYACYLLLYLPMYK